MSNETHDDIGDVYAEAAAKGPEALYAEWAARYDADNAALGFRLPAVAAGFAARHVPLGSGPVLDAGAGTGQVGSCLQILGYDDITAIDISEPMLAVAAGTGAYRSLKRQVLGERLAFPDDHFAGVLCIGSFGPGHAPPKSLEELTRVARPGAPVIFNVIEHSWRQQGFPAAMEALSEAGRWTLAEERGPWRPYSIGEPDLFTRLFVFKAT